MDVTFGRWVLKPYQSNGQRCWQLFRRTDSGKLSNMPLCYPSTIQYAIEYAANYSARNDLDEDFDSLESAIERYGEILEQYRREATESFGDGKVVG
jgi:hypothetical protein